MAANAKQRTPASQLHLEKQVTDKMWIQPPKSSIKPQARNPITQEDIEVPPHPTYKKSPFIGTNPKPQGIAMGQYADKGKKSDIFGEPIQDSKPSRKYIAHSSSETFIPYQSLKKSEYQPPERNPITQETLDPYNPKIRTKISESSAFAHLHDGEGEIIKQRDNIYYEHMKRSVFSPDVVQQKRLAKECNTYAVEAGSVMKHDAVGISVSNDPTKNTIRTEDLMQKKVLEGNAKIYSVRRNESNVTF
ncbi:hypothetical protein SteCoe_20238 [Stentor coeruleus]|uniref:Uncharacterized protein n=1 Tax=Stentor coeruleus TaxID=5963 RepID=A0A1R2BSW5_9CILI|nr:hypothetical protein SteCoe_20238 [Stentor coeruleus]